MQAREPLQAAFHFLPDLRSEIRIYGFLETYNIQRDCQALQFEPLHLGFWQDHMDFWY